MNSNKQTFRTSFKPTVKLKSPGRINFIGEHTDYNGGFVLPTAIDKTIIFSLQVNDDHEKCNVYSKAIDSYLSFGLSEVTPSEKSWENYILGVVFEIQLLGKALSGFDCLIESELPLGSGISSSAALECGLAAGLNELFDLGLSKLEIVALSQRAEHNYVGTMCGIMDQYASVMSKRGTVILLDCKTQKHRYIEANFGDYEILLLNTNVSHSLADSAYNDRRSSCEEVATSLKKYDESIACLRDVPLSLLKKHQSDFSEVLYGRAKYVLEENNRVLTAASALEAGDLKRFGELMYASHLGLQFKYEVSCKELDFLVDFSREYSEVIGSRMMGGGFGGCTINLIHKDSVDQYIEKVSLAYKAAFGISLSAFLTTPSEGTVIEERL